MEKEPRRLISRVVEFAVLFAISAFLLRLGAYYLADVWWILLIVGIAVIGVTIWLHARRNANRW